MLLRVVVVLPLLIECPGFFLSEPRDLVESGSVNLVIGWPVGSLSNILSLAEASSHCLFCEMVVVFFLSGVFSTNSPSYVSCACDVFPYVLIVSLLLFFLCLFAGDGGDVRCDELGVFLVLLCDVSF